MYRAAAIVLFALGMTAIPGQTYAARSDLVQGQTKATCAASVTTLTLSAGFHFMYAHDRTIDVDPPADMPTGDIPMQVPVYPGAIAGSTVLTHPVFTYPTTEYLKTATAEYVLQADMQTAADWYLSALQLCGYVRHNAGSYYSANGQMLATGMLFWPMQGAGPTLWLSFEPASGGGTLVEYIAEYVAIPPRPASTLAPRKASSVHVRYSPDESTSLSLTISRPGEVRRLVAAVNALQIDVSTYHGCAADGSGTATLTFRGKNESLSALLTGCHDVQVGDTELADGQSSVWSVLTGIVDAHCPNLGCSQVRHT